MTDALAPASPPPEASPAARRRSVVVVTGLSGAGKSSVLRALEDLGHETVDNPPLALLGALVTTAAAPAEGGPPRPLAVGVDVRTRGFDAAAVRAGLAALRERPEAVEMALVFATAADDALLRRYSETRRRHPLAEGAGVAEGIARERALLAPLAEDADWLLDTTGLPLLDLRRAVERRFGPRDGADGGAAPGRGAMAVAVVSFAFPKGLPREADLVFDLRFLRNPHYDPALRPLTGRDAAVAAFVEADPDFAPFWARMTDLLDPLLPRYAAEGKKYLTVALGCTGGRHRSVLAAERLAHHIRATGWHADLAHRELPPTSPRRATTNSSGGDAAGTDPSPRPAAEAAGATDDPPAQSGPEARASPP